ncbi:carboxypeptidase regulatory-like domain-containing protein [Chloroflexi bacterium TSY]|nr:carboxypeptidase regulatory-like domain-containing protein [Chloroflexi bacterium TSY]
MGYLIANRLGTVGTPETGLAPGSITGRVLAAGQPVSNATVLVAERSGKPHVAQTDEDGVYLIADVPPGQYVPAAIAPGFAETAAEDVLGIPRLVTVHSQKMVTAPILNLVPHILQPLPKPLLPTVNLVQTEVYTSTAPYPEGAAAEVFAYRFEHNGEEIDTLRLYLTMDRTPEESLPILFMIYPTHVDAWETVSVAFASQGYGFVAISPIAARQTDVDAHAQDAYIALALAQEGALHPQLQYDPAIVLGGSFSSAILNRMLRDTRDRVAGWVTVGGISNAFDSTAGFYEGAIQIPVGYELAIPALGLPNLYPLDFLRYSPEYAASELPPTLIIHTDADLIIPIEHAYEMEAALRKANVPVEVFYYEDVSHYLQIDENLTEAGKEMFQRILDFAGQHMTTN